MTTQSCFIISSDHDWQHYMCLLLFALQQYPATLTSTRAQNSRVEQAGMTVLTVTVLGQLVLCIAGSQVQSCSVHTLMCNIILKMVHTLMCNIVIKIAHTLICNKILKIVHIIICKIILKLEKSLAHSMQPNMDAAQH